MPALVSSLQIFLWEPARWTSARDLRPLNSSGQRISVGARFRKVADSPLIITLQVSRIQVSYPHTGRTYISQCRKPIPKYPVRDRGSIKKNNPVVHSRTGGRMVASKSPPTRNVSDAKNTGSVSCAQWSLIDWTSRDRRISGGFSLAMRKKNFQREGLTR